eukprot:tig00001000_g6183.t1
MASRRPLLVASIEEEGVLLEEEEADIASGSGSGQAHGWREVAVSAISGAAAGFTVDLVMYPIDTVKTRLQARDVRGLVNLRGLYRGVGPALLAAAPAGASFFTAYDGTKAALAGSVPPAAGQVVAAAVATVFAAGLRTPFELVKQNMQTGAYSTGLEAAGAIYRSRGLRGLFAGYGSLIAREIPFDCIQFPMYEQIKDVAGRAAGGRPLHPHEIVFVGMTAGAISAGLTNPLDVVKTRIMTQGEGARRYAGVADACRSILREEGPRAFLRGVLPRMTMIGLGGSVFFTAFETTKRAVEPRLLGAGPGPGPRPAGP